MSIHRSYKTLDLKMSASMGDVKKAYKNMVRVWHPDRFTANPRLHAKANEKLKEINRAYQEILIFLERDLSMVDLRETTTEPRKGPYEPKRQKNSSLWHLFLALFTFFKSFIPSTRFQNFIREVKISSISTSGRPVSSLKKQHTPSNGTHDKKSPNVRKGKRFSEIMDEVARNNRNRGHPS